MKKNYFYFYCIVCLFVFPNGFGQVGIGTSSPKGALDIQSTQYGVVFPQVALTATNLQAPVVNPTGSSLQVGTTIYNTNTTNSGSFDVEPGIYAWSGSIWVKQYYKSQVEIFTQTNILRTRSTGSFQEVPGLKPSQEKKFFAKYTGLYKIEVRANYGGGAMVDNDAVNVGLFEGDFRFILDTTPYLIHAKSYSIFNQYIGTTGTNFSNISDQVYRIIYVNLVENTYYNFSLEFDQADDPDPDFLKGYLGNGNNNATYGDGRGYVGVDIPCYIEFTFLKE